LDVPQQASPNKSAPTQLTKPDDESQTIKVWDAGSGEEVMD